MKIFLAGATGVIGRALVPRLVKAGHVVVGMTQHPDKQHLLRSLGAKPLVVDVYQREALFSALRAERPAVVIDQLTSLQRGDYAANRRIRIEGTRNLVDAVQDAGIRRIVAQSFCLYAPGPGPAQENAPLDVESGIYGKSIDGILALERIVGEFPGGVILRYGMLYGPGTWFAPDGRIADQMRRGEFVANDDILSFLHVEDAALAALMAIAWPEGIFNIADDEPASAREWAPAFAAAIGVPVPRYQPGGTLRRGASNAKARRGFGWRPLYTSWREGFQTLLAPTARRAH